MRLSVLLRTIDFRGDHSADVLIAHDVRPGETVEELATRLLGKEPYITAEAKVIEIRFVVPASGAAAGKGTTP